MQDWRDLGLNIEGGGNMLAPTINRSDFEWRDPTGDEFITRQVFGSGGDSGVEMETVQNPEYRKAGYYMSDAARSRLGQWSKNDPTSISWGWSPKDGRDWGDGGDSYFNFADEAGLNDFFNQDTIQAAVKTADKKGTGVQWKRQGDSFVPVGKSNAFGWDTNPDHSQAAMAFAALASMGLAAPAVAGAGAASGGSALGTGLSLSQIGSGLNFANMATGGNIPGLREAGLASSIFGSGAGLASNLAGGVNSASDLSSLFKDGYNVYSKGSKLMDMFSGPDEQYANSTFGGGGQTAPRNNVAGVPGSGVTSSHEYNPNPGDSTPMSPDGNRMVNPNINPSRASYGNEGDGWLYDQGGAGGGTGTPDSGGMNSSGFDLDSLWRMISGGAGGGGTGLADLWGAWEGSRQAKDSAGNYKRMYSDAQARRQPYLDRLNESYTNPNSFYDTSQWKGLSDVYKNSIDRKAGQAGRLANPTDREVLLNNFALKELENYRTGLRGNAQMLNPDHYINPNMRGLDLERGANNPWGAAIGRGGVGGPGLNQGASGLQQLISQLLKGGGGGGVGTNPDIVRAIQGFIGQPGGSGPGGVGIGNWSSGGDIDAPYNPYTGFNEPTFGGDTWGDGPTDWGPAEVDPDWGFNADGGNGFDIGDFDVEDTGWIDDIGSWFDW